MAVSGEVTIAKDGGNVKLHPYLIALLRWCASCLWSTATVFVHRLVTSPLPPIGAPPKPASKPRPAGTDHLHPVPKVECVVLHQPEEHDMDVIFVHGLYGSLANTWRQGEWMPKYKMGPKLVPLRRPKSIPTICGNCSQNSQNNCNIDDEIVMSDEYYNNCDNFTKATNEIYITESFYNTNLLDQIEIVDNYETQAKFVQDLFESETKTIMFSENDTDIYQSEYQNDDKNEYYYKNNGVKEYYYKRYDNFCENNDKIDNYCENSDDIDNYCENSDDIDNYCENSDDIDNYCENSDELHNCCDNSDELHNYCDNSDEFNKCLCSDCEVGCGCICDKCYSACWPKDWIKEDFPRARVISINYTSDPHLWRPLWVKESKRLRLHERAEQMTKQLLDLGVGCNPVVWVGHSKGGLFIKQIYCEAYEAYIKINKSCDTNEDQLCDKSVNTDNVDSNEHSKLVLDIKIGNEVDGCGLGNSSNTEEDLLKQSKLWINSVAFMFYSVPHRGSPLADIKTPITARSIELLEISKDCPLVLSLQDRWLGASSPRAPLVRSLVETCRTLMSVLYLRIVSVDSADAGIGALCGVPVDHREICKPSSRHCVLYKELTNLIHSALNKCDCQ